MQRLINIIQIVIDATVAGGLGPQSDVAAVTSGLKNQKASLQCGLDLINAIIAYEAFTKENEKKPTPQTTEALKARAAETETLLNKFKATIASFGSRKIGYGLDGSFGRISTQAGSILRLLQGALQKLQASISLSAGGGGGITIGGGGSGGIISEIAGQIAGKIWRVYLWF